MASSGGNTISHWRVLTQLRNYLSKSHPSLAAQSIQNDIADLLKLSTKNVNFGNEEKDILLKKENETKEETPAVEDAKSSYNEVKKAINSLNSYIPQLPPVLSLRGNNDVPTPETSPKHSPAKWRLKKKNVISRTSVDSRTRHLMKGLEPGLGSSVTLRRIEDLCTHLQEYPDTRGVAIKNSGVSRLLQVLHQTKDVYTMESVREALALLGYSEPVKGHGIRILSLDGGGTRGLVAIDMLRHIESKAGQPIHELFDFICGVSTGAIIAVLVGAHRLSLDECEKLYRDMSIQIFSQTTFKGTASLVWNNSFYDSDAWTQILQKHMADTPMIETRKTQEMNKLCLVSTLTNNNWVKAFLFRNYTFPYRVASHFNGSTSARLWEGVRASAAAPGYFSEFRLNDLNLLDGGVMVNNPTAIAIHEARKLWPDTPLQSVVSVGTGRHEPLAVDSDKSINWASRIRTIINSATDTEGVHTTLHDLLPGDVYFRFNPYLSEEINLDEIRAEKLASMIEDTGLYVRKNESIFEGAILSLARNKSLVDKALDYTYLKKQIWDLQ